MSSIESGSNAPGMNEFEGSERRTTDEDSLAYWQDQVSRLSREIDHFRELAYTDSVTGLPNRRHFDEVLSSSIGRTDLMLAIVDLNDFADVNNRYGHDAGDEALKVFGDVLRDSVRKKSDMVFRIGGDEFAIIGSASSTVDEEQIAPSIRGRVESKLKRVNEEMGVGISVSLGAAISRKSQPLTAKELFIKADQNMYKEKKDKEK